MDRAFLVSLGMFTALAVVFLAVLSALNVRRNAPTGDASDSVAGARRIYFVGQLFGALLIAAAVAHQSAQGEDLALDALWTMAFGGVGFALYLLGGQLGVRLLLGGQLAQEIEEGNTAAALAAAAHHIAIAMLAAQASSGVDLPALVRAGGFFLLGAVVHQIVVALFRAFTTYDDAEQIAGENLAAALRYAGASLGTAIIVARALEGDSVDASEVALGFATVAAVALVLIPVRQLVAGGLLVGKMPKLRGGPLDDAVVLKHDPALAAMDAAVAIGAALAFVRLMD